MMFSQTRILPTHRAGNQPLYSSVILVLLCLLTAATGQARSGKGRVEEIRTLYPSEWNVPYPAGVAYASAYDLLFLLDGKEVGSVQTTYSTAAIITPYEDLVAMVQLPVTFDDAMNMTYDDANEHLLLLDDKTAELSIFGAEESGQLSDPANFDIADLALEDAEGIAMDADAGILYILDRGAAQIVRAKIGDGEVTLLGKNSLKHLGSHKLRGIAIHPQSRHIFVASPKEHVLYELRENGRLVNRYDLTSLELVDLRAMAFAPSADLTDHPETVHLYLTDSNLSDEEMAQGGVPQWFGSLCRSSSEGPLNILFTNTCAYSVIEESGTGFGRLLETELIRGTRNDLCTLQ